MSECNCGCNCNCPCCNYDKIEAYIGLEAEGAKESEVCVEFPVSKEIFLAAFVLAKLDSKD